MLIETDTKHEIQGFFQCICKNISHQMHYSDIPYCENGKIVYDEVFLEIHLSQSMPWYRRIISAITYVFGYRTKYGNWDTLALSNADLIRLRDMLNASIEKRKHD